MNFELSASARDVRELVERFTREELLPLEELALSREAAPDEIHTALPHDIESELQAKARNLGLWGIDVPEEFGGSDLGAVAKYEAIQQLSYSAVFFNLPPDSPNLHFLKACCTGSQIDRYLIPYARGEKTSCLALTEPGAGSDAAGIKTRAERKNGKWVINGQKLWISNAKTADFMILIAVTDKDKGAYGGITAFLVDKGTPGVTISEKYPVISGMFNSYGVFLDNVELDDSQVLGEVGNGFGPLQNRLGIRRMEIAGRCIGHAMRCIDMMIEYARQRSTFGTLLADRQMVQCWISDSFTELEMVQLLTYRLATALDHPDAEAKRDQIRRDAAMVKVQATEMATRVIDRAIQLHGGLGVSRQMPFEYFYRFVRVLRIVEGPSEIHRWTVARDLLRSGRPIT